MLHSMLCVFCFPSVHELKSNKQPIAMPIQVTSVSTYLHVHSTLQVTSKLCNACNLVASAVPHLLKSDANLVVTGLVDKMGDTKVKPHACELLDTLAEVCTRDRM